MAQNKVWTVIGARGSGKTPFIIGGDFEKGIAAKWLSRGMSTLIIDEIDHPRYRHIPFLHPKDYKQLSSHPGIYRTLCRTQDMDDLIFKIANQQLVWNTAIVFEDCPKYIPKVFRRDIETTLIGNSKQQNTDVFFLGWSWKDTSPDICRKTNYFVVMKSADNPTYRKDDVPGGSYEPLMKAHELVMAGKKPYVIVETPI